MQTEKRLIDAIDALERLKKAEEKMKLVTIVGYKAVPMYAVIDFIASRPTVDAVEVVRCKDCKYQHDYDCPLSDCCKEPTDFCSYGERRTTND